MTDSSLSSIPSQPQRNYYWDDDDNNTKSKKPPTLKTISITSLGGILAGYHLAVASVALPSLTSEFDLTSTQEESVAGALYFGGVFGCWFGGYICDFFGRRRAIQCTDLIFIIGCLILSISNSYTAVLFGRVITGFATALSGVATVTYLTEMAPKEIRGGTVTTNELFMSFGILIAYLIGYGSSRNSGDMGRWRVMFGCPSVLAFIQALLMMTMPESKVWLRLGQGGRDSMVLKDEDVNGEQQQERSGLENQSLQQQERKDLRASIDRLDVGHNNDDAAQETAREGEQQQQKQSEPQKTRTSYTSRAWWDDPDAQHDDDDIFDETHVSVDTEQKEDISLTTPSLTSSADEPPSEQQQNSPDHAEAMLKNHSSSSLVQIQGAGEGEEEELFTNISIYPTILSPPVGISKAYYYHSIIIVITLAIAQQFCGHVNILNFAPDIFAETMGYNNEEEDENLAKTFVPTIFLGCIKVVVTAWVIYEVDTGFGRRSLLILGLVLICISLFLIICAFAGEQDFADMSTAQEVTAVLGIAGLVIGYAASFGPLTWLITSELFPPSIRGRALGYSELVTMVSAYLASYTFLSGQEYFGPAVPFALYFVVSLLTLGFVIAAVPDTANENEDGSNYDDIEKDMENMWLWRRGFSLPMPSEWVEDDINYNSRRSLV